MLALKPLEEITQYEFKELTAPLTCFTKGKSVPNLSRIGSKLWPLSC